MRRTTLLPLLLLGACASLEGETAQATPQRPTISSDTYTTHEGTWEVEAGLEYDPDDFLAVPTLIKYGAGPRTELFLGWTPYQRIEMPGGDAHGIGDLKPGVRHRLWDEEDAMPSAALQLTTKLPATDRTRGLSTGEIDFFAAGILTKSYEPVTTNLFYEAGFLGNATGGGANLQHTLTAGAGIPLADRWSAFGELALVSTPALATDSLLAMVGGAFAVTKGFVVDVAVVVGINDAAPDFQILFGFTSNLGSHLIMGGVPRVTGQRLRDD